MSGLFPGVAPPPPKRRSRKSSSLRDEDLARSEPGPKRLEEKQRLEVHAGWSREELREARVWAGKSAADLARKIGIGTSGVLRCEQELVHPATGWRRWVEAVEEWIDEVVAADGRRWEDIWPTPVPTARLKESWKRILNKPALGADMEW